MERCLHIAKQMSSAFLSIAPNGAPSSTHWVTGESHVMRALETSVEEIAGCLCPGTLIGDAGTGKHALALRLYELSSRIDGAFLEVECARATEDSFRGESRFLQCGTLFLDELTALRSGGPPGLRETYFGARAEWLTRPRRVAGSRYELDACGSDSASQLFRCLSATPT